MSNGLLFLGGLLLGAVIMLALVRLTSLSLRTLGVATVGLAVLSIILFGATYKDEFCDEDTACRLLAEPSFFTLVTVVPGMVAGLFVAAAWGERAGQR